MQFIEMTGRTLLRVISPEEVHPEDLKKAGVTSDSVVRVNLQGDVELRKRDGWEILGGLLGDYDHRVKRDGAGLGIGLVGFCLVTKLAKAI